MNLNNIQHIKINDLSLDPRLQMREEMSKEAIEEYAEHLDDLPPAMVMLDSSGHLLLYDGWHHLEAMKLKGGDTLPCEVTEGEFKNAVVAAAGANATHGVRRTNADKRKAVKTMFVLLKEIGEDWTDRAVATACKVGHSLVADVRAQLAFQPTETNNDSENSESSEPAKRTGADGKSYSARRYPKERDLRCQRCKDRKIDIGDNCPACKAKKAEYLANKSKGGDRRKKSAGSNGTIVKVWKDAEILLGAFIRELGLLAVQYGLKSKRGNGIDDPGYHGLDRKVKELMNEGRDWSKEQEKRLKEKKE